jgi:hypothetical protein
MVSMSMPQAVLLPFRGSSLCQRPERPPDLMYISLPGFALVFPLNRGINLTFLSEPGWSRVTTRLT